VSCRMEVLRPQITSEEITFSRSPYGAFFHGSAVIPTAVANAFFMPRRLLRQARESTAQEMIPKQTIVDEVE
jgi:hypothetical protein